MLPVVSSNYWEDIELRFRCDWGHCEKVWTKVAWRNGNKVMPTE